MIECKNCVNYLIGECQYSLHSAACLQCAKDWHEEPQDKLLDWVTRVKKWEQEKFFQRMAYLDTIERRIREKENEE